jgi:hypothetical protein
MPELPTVLYYLLRIWPNATVEYVTEDESDG